MNKKFVEIKFSGHIFPEFQTHRKTYTIFINF